MEKQQLIDALKTRFPGAEFPEGTQFPEMIISPDQLHETAQALRSEELFCFDYLVSLTAVDFIKQMTIVYHLESIGHRRLIVLKTSVSDRENPAVDTVSDIWTGAGFHEREVFDLFGIRFTNHPDLRRLFMDDDYGYPLRKDFRDEINIIER